MKWLLITEKGSVVARRIKDGARPMVGIKGRVYRLDEGWMIQDQRSMDVICIYPLNGTQPMTADGQYLDSDMTKAYIDSAKLSAGGKRRILSSLDDITGMISKLLVAVILVGAMAMFLIELIRWIR